MQTIQFSFKKSYWGSVVFLLPLTLLLIFSSCKGKKESFAGMDVSCAVLLQQKMKDAWETPGYFKSIDYFTFYSSYNRGTGNFSVGVQAFKKDYSKIGGYIDLTTGTGCNVNLPNGVAIGENNISLTNLNILKADGTLQDFDYMKLIPKVCPENDAFMCFDVDLVTGGVGGEMRVTLPCPPCIYCKPPCVTMERTTDSLMNVNDTTGQKAQ